ncbi:glycosyltransferase [Peribacillus frigoritolerans]|uniref:glycosyltransferase n=1 Tax=Peribacillus frigoritolerans TaxID=450367 RepID=UPI002B057BCB|nr:glycosyltransferase [Peribacillus frigoritolerans]MEA3573929.1 glycosyltransferase [Peribacillus frigoritolerans]
MKKKNIYICFLREESEIIGILNKIRQQCLALNNLGVVSSLIISRNNSVVLYEINNNEFIEKHLVNYSKYGKYNEEQNKYLKKISSFTRLKEFLSFAKQMINEINPDSIYIRNISPITLDVVNFIKLLSKKDYTVYWEIPTYSKYNKKAKNINQLYDNYMHKYISSFLSKNIAIAAEEGLEKEGYIFTTNGVNVNNVKLRNPISHQNINLICVATFDYWHGYDRLIEGLKNFYDSNDTGRVVHLHMVGNGNTKPLKDLVLKYNLEDYVTFHGVLIGDTLDNLFDYMDIAVGNLGFHRRGVYADTSIKIREYCARGIPFITALKDSDFPEGFQYLIKMPADESAIDIERVINFYHKVNKNNLDFSKAMREYAVKNLSWEEKMKFIVEDIY